MADLRIQGYASVAHDHRHRTADPAIATSQGRSPRVPVRRIAGGAQLSSVKIGSANPNSAPPAGRGRPQIRPPIASMSARHTNSPIPAPVVVELVFEPRKKRS